MGKKSAGSSMTVAEAGRLGGVANREKYGPEHYREIGRKGGAANAAAHGPEHYREIGRKGGAANAALHGPEHYREIGRKGGAAVKAKHPEQFREMSRKGVARVKELVSAGKASEASEDFEPVDPEYDGDARGDDEPEAGDESDTVEE